MIKKHFFAGLVTLLPLAVTIMAIVFIVDFLTKPFMGFVTQLLGLLPIRSDNLIRTISQILILLTIFLFTWGIGVLARRFFFKTLMQVGERLLSAIPIVNKVYKTIREIFQTLLSGDKNTLQQVVMFPFPHKGSYVLGLISRDAPQTCSQSDNAELISIFVPATPNPLTGYLIMRPKSELIYLDMSNEDAIKYVVSCGIVIPKTVSPERS